MHDNPFDAAVFGIEAEEAFVPFTSKGTVISFDSRVPTACEDQNLPVILITEDLWDPVNVELGIRIRDTA